MKTNSIRSVIAAFLGISAISLNAAVIDFEADALGDVPNGFTSAGHPLVSFSDSSGAELNIGHYGTQGDGISLAVSDDSDGSKIRMDFAVSLTSLSLDFGNDDGDWANPTDRAWLEIFNGGISVGLVSMAMNLDDIMNQTIAYSGLPFDRADFWYGDAAGNPFTYNANNDLIGLIEIIDHINYTPANVPDAGNTLTLAGLALLGLAAARRRQAA